MTDRDTQIVRAALEWAAMAEELRSEAARSQAAKEPSGSQSRARMMARARQSLQGAYNIRALAGDPARTGCGRSPAPELSFPVERRGKGISEVKLPSLRKKYCDRPWCGMFAGGDRARGGRWVAAD